MRRSAVRSLPRPSATHSLRVIGLAVAALLLTLLVGCGDGSGPGDLRLEFSQSAVDFGATRTATVTLSNAGGGALGPVQITMAPIQGNGGGNVAGVEVNPQPAFISTLDPGASSDVNLTVSITAPLSAGQYSSTLTAAAGTDASITLPVSFEVTTAAIGSLQSLDIVAGPSTARQGDVVQFAAQGVDTLGTTVDVPAVDWAINPASAGMITPTGELVAYESGSVTVVASAGSLTASRALDITARGLSGNASIVGTGSVPSRFTSDLWAFGDNAYTGTWGRRTVGGTSTDGNALNTWDISNPASPALTHTLTVDARTVNDVKVRADGALGLITHEGSNDGLNGVTLLDLSNPSTPSVHARYTTGLESGVHNAWLEGNYAYLVVDGGSGGMRVLDVSDPTSPTQVASFYGGASFLHDIYVRDGIAFLAHWGVGLIVMDVGNGMAGGSPTNPVEVSRLFIAGETHNAWYWPAAGYVFVGEEDFGTPGMMHVIDVSNMSSPREVATFAVPGTTPHNFWLDESTGVLYLAWYDNGLRALDVSGTLMGDLGRQGREYFGAVYNGGGCNSGTCTWAPQLHRGLVWVSDMNTGLVALNPSLP